MGTGAQERELLVHSIVDICEAREEILKNRAMIALEPRELPGSLHTPAVHEAHLVFEPRDERVVFDLRHDTIFAHTGEETVVQLREEPIRIRDEGLRIHAGFSQISHRHTGGD